MKNKNFKRPNGKYWTPKDMEELEKVETYEKMFLIALRILERMPQPITQICGPITTGGNSSKEENVKEFNKAIFFFSERGEMVFDQIPFQNTMERLSKEVNGYDERILIKFYLPLFQSGKVKTFKFLPGWQSSKGAKWEHKTIKQLKYKIIHLEPEWHNITV